MPMPARRIRLTFFIGMAFIGMAAILLAMLATPAAAQNFRAGYNAYLRGDFATALREWEPLALKGYAQAQTNLGTMYSHAKGVDRNYPLAAYWYRKAAAQGSKRSMYNLGVAYEFGRGVEQNDATALNWYRQAALQNLVEAMNAIAWLYATSPDDNLRDGHQAIRWAEKALTGRTIAKHLGTLAAAYAETGEFNKAVAAVERAINALDRELYRKPVAHTQRDLFLLVRLVGRTDEATRLLEQLEFYRSGLPVRD